MPLLSSSKPARWRPAFLLLCLVVAAYVAWVLSLPAWPSQDGPVHLYFAHVLDVLFSGAPSPFRNFFYVKHLLPPYALYYYSLLALSHVASLLVADKLIVCAYLVLFAFGFRYAARAIGPGADLAALLATAVLLNWSLGMGFVNYCLSLAIALWAIGLWLRLGDQPAFGRRFVFVLLAVLITLSHPVPLLLVLAFAGLDLLLRALRVRQSLAVDGRRLLPDLLTLVAASLCLLYVKVFTVAHPLEQRHHRVLSWLIMRRIKDVLIAKNVVLLKGHWWEVRLYGGSLLLLLLAAVVVVGIQWRRSRASGRWTRGESMTVFFVLFALAIPVLPSDVSGAYYFTERLEMLLWVTALLAASSWNPYASPAKLAYPLEAGAETSSTPAFAVIATFTVAFTLLLLHAANATLRPYAQRDAALSRVTLPISGQIVTLLAGRDVRPRHAAPQWDPHYWDTVALLRRNDGILANAPWLDSPIIPLAARPILPAAALTSSIANSPYDLTRDLNTDPALQATTLGHSTLVLFSPPVDQGNAVEAVVQPDGWTCPAGTGDLYRLCTRAAITTPATVAASPH